MECLYFICILFAYSMCIFVLYECEYVWMYTYTVHVDVHMYALNIYIHVRICTCMYALRSCMYICTNVSIIR